MSGADDFFNEIEQGLDKRDMTIDEMTEVAEGIGVGLYEYIMKKCRERVGAEPGSALVDLTKNLYAHINHGGAGSLDPCHKLVTAKESELQAAVDDFRSSLESAQSAELPPAAMTTIEDANDCASAKRKLKSLLDLMAPIEGHESASVVWTGWPVAPALAVLYSAKGTKEDDGTYRSLESWVCMTMQQELFGDWNGASKKLSEWIQNTFTLVGKKMPTSKSWPNMKDPKSSKDFALIVMMSYITLMSETLAKGTYNPFASAALQLVDLKPVDSRFPPQGGWDISKREGKSFKESVFVKTELQALLDENKKLGIVAFFSDEILGAKAWNIYFKDGEIHVDKLEGKTPIQVSDDTLEVDALLKFYKKLVNAGMEVVEGGGELKKFVAENEAVAEVFYFQKRVEFLDKMAESGSIPPRTPRMHRVVKEATAQARGTSTPAAAPTSTATSPASTAPTPTAASTPTPTPRPLEDSPKTLKPGSHELAHIAHLTSGARGALSTGAGAGVPEPASPSVAGPGSGLAEGPEPASPSVAGSDSGLAEGEAALSQAGGKRRKVRRTKRYSKKRRKSTRRKYTKRRKSTRRKYTKRRKSTRRKYTKRRRSKRRKK